jgi:hypothetical protein
MLLIYSPEGHWDSLPDGERDALYEEYLALDRELARRGALVGSHELQPASTATSVRIRDGRTLVADGPFADTKERLGGYYVIEAESLDEAIAVAERIPSARHGVVEVRPVVLRQAEAAR